MVEGAIITDVLWRGYFHFVFSAERKDLWMLVVFRSGPKTKSLSITLSYPYVCIGCFFVVVCLFFNRQNNMLNLLYCTLCNRALSVHPLRQCPQLWVLCLAAAFEHIFDGPVEQGTLPGQLSKCSSRGRLLGEDLLESEPGVKASLTPHQMLSF